MGEMHQTDLLGRRVPSRLGGATVWFQAVPGMAGQFRKTVPKSHIRRPNTDTAVACPCGSETPVKDHQGCIVECVGECGRFFLPTGQDIWVAGPYPADEPAAA